MAKQRTERLNSLLREVISEVIRREIRNPKIPQLMSITRVDITKDLSFAKVFVSFIGDDINTKEALRALQSAAGFISGVCAKKVVMRTFPQLKFVYDDSVQQHLRIEQVLSDISTEEKQRNPQVDE